MRRIGLLIITLSLGISAPAHAALDAQVVLVRGSSLRDVLPAYAAAARAPRKNSTAAATLPPVVLWSTGEEEWTNELLVRLAPKKLIALGGGALATIGAAKAKQLPAGDRELARAAFAKGPPPPAVYLAGAEDVAAALSAAVLAASERAPLLIAKGAPASRIAEAGELARELKARSVIVVGAGDVEALASRAGITVAVRTGEEALALYNAKVKHAHHLVVAAPSDVRGPFSPPKLSLGAVPYALAKGAPLAWVGAGAGGTRTPEEATADLEAKGFGPFDSITIVGDQLAVPMREILDIDQVARKVKSPRVHKLPPFVAPDGSASDRAVGRLAALDVYDLSRWVVRLLHDTERRADGDGALVFANADRKFVLGETISRTTSAELRNAGVEVDAYYGDAITPGLIRKELNEHALVLWEGHPRDLTLDDDALPAPDDEPLPPATFFIQGCYTLDRSDPYVLIERGANAVIGSHMAVYSASGSGFARAYLSAQLHDGATAGEALARARNFLLATVELKKRRGHKDFRKTHRAALSFELWGDPTAKLPVSHGAPRKAPVSAKVSGNTLRVHVPRAHLGKVESGSYRATIRPNAQLSALYDIPEGTKERRLIELFFVEVDVPARFGEAPLVEGGDPTTYAWVFSPRTRKLSLLIHEAALKRPAAGGTIKLSLRPRMQQPR